MIAAVVSGSTGRGHLVRQVGDHHHLILERLQRSQRARQLEIGALALGRPIGHYRAMRNEAQPQLNFGICRGLRERRLGRQHRIEQRKR